MKFRTMTLKLGMPHYYLILNNKRYISFRTENAKNKKKRSLKRKNKKIGKNMKEKLKSFEQKKTKVHVNRPLLEGVSIFDLIIPWRVN